MPRPTLSYLDFPYEHHVGRYINNVRDRADSELKRRSRVVHCAHALCNALHLPGGHAVGHHLGHSGDDRAVHTREPLDEVLGEVAAARSFGTLRSMVPMLVTSLRSR